MRLSIMLSLLALVSLPGCERKPPAATQAPAEYAEETMQTNRVAIPENVRRNLGMTFARVERRSVESVLRLAGTFELPPEARREIHLMLPGRVELLVTQYERVEAGQVLLRLDSPRWREHVLELEKARLEIVRAEADVEMAKATLTEAEGVITITEARLDALAAIEVKRVDLDLELSRAKNSLPRHRADLRAREAALQEAREHYPLLLASAAAIVGVDATLLDQPTSEGEPVWRGIGVIEVRAPTDGVVERVSVTDGSWIDVGGHVITLMQPERVRLRASALQRDVVRVSPDARAFVVPAGADATERVVGTLAIAPIARPDAWSIDLLFTPSSAPGWARPGTTAFIDIVLDAASPTDLAIPAGAVVKDGLVPVVFVRDRNDPDKAIRLEADLGISDGRYVAILSDVRVGDEVVVRGAYDLNLATGGTQSQGGHFHPDGTFHEEH